MDGGSTNSTQPSAHGKTEILVSTGEVSGDVIGARLAEELRELSPGIQLTGVGGGRMKRAGVEILFDTNHLGSVGITEPLATIPGIVRSFTRVHRHVLRKPPQAAVLIGHDMFNILLARWLRSRRVPTVAYFPPQVWVWRAGARPIAASYDLVLTSFREEHDVYRQAGASVVFVGHYLRDLPEVSPEMRRTARESLRLEPQGRVIGLFPGSRHHEVRALGPILLDTAKRMLARDASLKFILPVADPSLADRLRGMVTSRALAGHVELLADSRSAMSASDVVLLCSGTATLEAALMGIPMVIVYRVSPLTRAVVRALLWTRVLTTERTGLPNLLAGREIVPELLHSQARPETIEEATWPLLTDADRIAQMRRDLATVVDQLGEPGAIRRAAREVLAGAATADELGRRIVSAAACATT